MASVGVVALSDDSIVDEWRIWNIKIQPQVWLAIFSTITNAMLGFALVDGLTIHFWKRAGRGMTVSQGFSCFFFLERVYVKLMDALDQSCENYMIFMSPWPFLAPWKPSRIAAGTWSVSLSQRHTVHSLQGRGFIISCSRFSSADID